MIEIGSKWIFRGDKSTIGEVVFIGPDGKHVIHAPGNGGTFVYQNEVYEFGDSDGGWKPYKEPVTITKYVYTYKYSADFDGKIYMSGDTWFSEEKIKNISAVKSGDIEILKIIPVTYVEGE